MQFLRHSTSYSWDNKPMCITFRFITSLLLIFPINQLEYQCMENYSTWGEVKWQIQHEKKLNGVFDTIATYLQPVITNIYSYVCN